MVNYQRSIVVFVDPIIQAYYEEFLKERIGSKKLWVWRKGFGEAKYEHLRKEFLRKTIYPTTIKIMRKEGRRK